ncbi:MAG: hypothetical protein U5K30_16720 [Acidimicrobiales bacterium]|nr:hypothetical protein [Acidimicrobiales bacterium]
MPGETPSSVHLVGSATADLVDALAHLAGFDFALVGGLAVMARIGAGHRATNDLDGVFDNVDGDTTAVLVHAGVAENDPAIQRVRIDGTKIDIIDTAELPADPDALPDDPKGLLFVCAHRWAFESATPLRLISDHREVVVQVAVPDALVAMKSHALRWATPQRRSTKRVSDLHDLYRLIGLPEIGDALEGAPWGLAHQVPTALAEDLGNGAQAAALLRSSTAPDIAATDPDDFIETMLTFLTRIARSG